MPSTTRDASAAISDSNTDFIKYKYILLVLYVFLTGIFATQSFESIITQDQAYFLGLLGYLSLFLFFYYTGSLEIGGEKSMVAVTLALCAIFVVPVIQSTDIRVIARLIVFPVLILINFFIIPAVIPRASFYAVLARMAAISTLIGLPVLIVGSIGPLQEATTGSPPGFPVALPALMSFFGNQNTLGAIAVYGALASLWEYFSANNRLALGLFLINLAGVYFSRGRAAGLALLAGISIVAIYRFTNRRGLITVTVAGVITAPTLILIKFGVIPGPTFIQSVDFSNRVELWTAAFQAALERPFFGWGIGNVPEAMESHLTGSRLSGAGPHTSYVRMFAATGIVGGLLYMYIYLKSMLTRLVSITDNADATEYGMVIGVVVIHTFSGNSLFGIALVSVVPAVIFGYAQQADLS